MRLPLVPFAAFFSACSHVAAPAPAPVPAPAAPPAATPIGEPAHADTFGTLLQHLVERGDENAGSDACLFRGEAGTLVFSGKFVPAVQPLPLHSTPLVTLLPAGAAVDVLTRYGRYEKRAPLPLFAAITEGAPAANTALIAQTTSGFWLRPVAGSTLPAIEVRDEGSVVSALESAHIQSAFVTADAGVTLAALAPLLRALEGAHVSVMLAAALPASASLRADSARESAFEGDCPHGLPEDRGPAGELPVAAIRAGIQPLTTGLLACLATGDIRALHGGRVRLALRIDAGGSVAQSCSVSSDVHDNAVLGCVLDRARALRFAVPSPAGTVDVELPLALQPAFASTPRVLCEGAAP